jgi:hypothetical protein
MARALLMQRGMPAVFWGEAVVTAVYILNRSPTKALNGRTPYEAWHGRKPAVVFDCLAFGKELGHIGKLDDRSTLGVFIGYADDSKVYRILYPGTQRVRTTRDVVFDEGRGWAWDKAVDDGSTPTYNFTVEYVHSNVPQSPSLHRPQRYAIQASSSTSTPTPARVENSVEFATPLPHDEERIDSYHDGEPLRYHMMENLLGDQPVPGLAPHDLEA